MEMFGDINVNNKKWMTYPLGELCTIVRGGSPRPIGTRVFVVISLGTVTPAVLAGVFVLVPSFIIRFPRCRLLCAPGRVSPQSGSPAPSLLSKVGIRLGFYGAQRTSFPRCGSSVLPGGKVPGGLCLRPCSVRLWGYWCVILSCGSPPF